MPARGEWLNSWRATERDLRAALALAKLEPKVALQIEEWLDHNELGLAFEEFVRALDLRPTGVPFEALWYLRSAFERMGADSFTDTALLDTWERLQKRPTS